MDPALHDLMEMFSASAPGTSVSEPFDPTGGDGKPEALSGRAAQGAQWMVAEITRLVERGAAMAVVSKGIMATAPLEQEPGREEPGMEALRPGAKEYLARWAEVEPGLRALRACLDRYRQAAEDSEARLAAPLRNVPRGWR